MPAAGAVPAASSLAAPPPRQAPAVQPEQRTADILASTDAPGRDIVSLTQRLKLHGTGIIPAVVNPKTPSYMVGTQHQFYVADMIKKGYFTIKATIRMVTPHAYWYVKDGYRYNLNTLRATASHFESHIYPTNRRIFGSEANPGVDNDPRITILMAPIPGVGGYFSSADAYPKQINPYSNERDMIYIAGVPTGKAGAASNYFEGTLAHELQHMIQWNVNRDRDVWLDEGYSEIAMFVNGYSTGGTDAAFITNPDTQLNAWGEPPKNGANYGASYLFLRYLGDKHGGEGFISTLLKQEGIGIDTIDAAVKASGSTAGFEGAFKDWIVANVLNDKTLAGGRYSYSEGGRVQPQRVLRSYPATRSDNVSQYAADYIKLNGSLNNATISFKGSSTIKVLPADPHSGQGFWYSNRRDTGDAMLTRELDLTGVRSATLQFWAWYDIESHYDYAYVVASTDGGRTWHPLKGRYTTSQNPNGNSFGQGWTGKSGVSANSTAPAKWVQEQLDLGAYAGKKVFVRFEYVTDEGYNKPGFAVDDIRVPEIGYVDDAEADNGWAAQGFVRIGNRMPQRWYVALVEKGITNRVREMVVDANGSGTLDLSSLGASKPIKEAILVIAPMAPKTTEKANYTVTIRRK
ncbi:MAG TPA: hypothetical protein VEX13_01560 [Chloroflexia bacterium]|nr:hypothetical protein [Chloroflexia bacterium]